MLLSPTIVFVSAVVCVSAISLFQPLSVFQPLPWFRKKIPVVKFPWPYRGSYFVKKKHRHSIRRGLVFLMVLLPLFILHFGNFVLVDSPRFPKSSGIDPKKALL